jgi:FkbM family methyltransferase
MALEIKLMLKKYSRRFIRVLFSPLGSYKLIVYIRIVRFFRFLGMRFLSQKLLKSFDLKGCSFVKTSIKTSFGVKYIYLTNSIDDLRYSCRSDFLEWEFVSRSFFTSIATNCEFILDIGAYTGVYSIEAALKNRNCIVRAFEPNPIIFSNLRNNIELNELSNRVGLFQSALGSKEGLSKLYIPEYSESTSISSLISESSRYIEVPVSTIDHIFYSQRIDLIKIDVEGYESEVFIGGQHVLDKSKPIILAEALTNDELVNQKLILSKYGYLEPIQVFSGSKSDKRNYVWFSKKDKLKVHSQLNISRYEFINRNSKFSQAQNKF